jgi:hypothetical protein
MSSTLLAAPERSREQRMEALRKANEVRSYRAVVKRELGAGRQPLVPLLSAPPAELETMKVYELLLALPKVGRVKANRVLATCRISPSKTLGGLSERQRGEILGLLRRR